MPTRLRKLIGAVLLVILVPTWALLAMALAQSPHVKSNGIVEVLYYVIAGLGWVLPAMPLIKWMSKGAPPRPFPPPQSASQTRVNALMPGED